MVNGSGSDSEHKWVNPKGFGSQRGKNEQAYTAEEILIVGGTVTAIGMFFCYLYMAGSDLLNGISKKSNPNLEKAKFDQIIQQVSKQDGVVSIKLTEEQMKVINEIFEQRPDLLEKLRQATNTLSPQAHSR